MLLHVIVWCNKITCLVLFISLTHNITLVYYTSNFTVNIDSYLLYWQYVIVVALINIERYFFLDKLTINCEH